MFKEKSDNLISATMDFLRALKIDFTQSYISDVLENHPDYPSLLTISDSLTRFNIDNASVSAFSDNLFDFPTPFMTLLNENGGKFVTVRNIKSDKIHYVIDNEEKTEIVDTFLKRWSKTALFAETNEFSGEPNYKFNQKSERAKSKNFAFLLLLGIIIIFSGVIGMNFNGVTLFIFTACILVFIKLIGISVSCLLLWYEIDKSNPFLQQICTSIKKTNCNAILLSRAARLFRIISWSEIGFFYFTGGLFFVLLRQDIASSLKVVGWLTILATPYTFFSVYYQWRIAKEWCALCLIVQVLLVGEFSTIIIFGINSMFVKFQISLSEIFLLLFSFGLPVLVWYFFKPILFKIPASKTERKRLNKFKYNHSIFESLLAKQKSVEVTAEGVGIMFGNPDAKNRIIKVCNPFCGPCAKAHLEIEKIVNANRNIKAQIIFTATPDIKDQKYIVVRHLMAIASNTNPLIMKNALDNWYLSPKKDYAAFARKYPMGKELNEQDDKIRLMHDWCVSSDVTFTPTIFVNDHQLPELYNVADLYYLLN